MSGTMRVGWIGTGVMGRSMCGHILAAGHEVTVSTRTREKAEPLLAQGAGWADTPREVAERSDYVFTIVGFPNDVREVILGAEGVLAGARAGSVIVDMTTSDPTLAAEIAAAAKAQDVDSLDAPVSGGDVGARNGTLTVMVGGEQGALDRVIPLLDTMSGSVVLQGGPGAGQHTKMVNQTLIASGMVGVCEALLYGYKAGLDLETVLTSVSAGAAGSWSLSNLAPRILKGDFAPGFMVDHFVKDMGIALDQADRMGLELPGLTLARRLYGELQDQGGGQNGTQALIRAVAKLSNLDWDAVTAK
jgi:3-hydroxyisobutyrate dehydrogenase